MSIPDSSFVVRVNTPISPGSRNMVQQFIEVKANGTNQALQQARAQYGNNAVLGAYSKPNSY